MNVKFVTRGSRVLVIWINTEERIRVKNHIHIDVNSVTKASNVLKNWFCIKEHIREKSQSSNVMYA